MMVQTVTGPIPVERMGRTLMHEHLTFGYYGVEFDPFMKLDRADIVKEGVRRLIQLRTEYGTHTLLDPTPIECGRDAALMKEISEKSGVNIICITGFYYEQYGIPFYWRARSIDEIAELYIREITHGIGDTGVKAGAIKVCTGAPVATELEKKFVRAGCIAHRETGVPIITHTTMGHAGPEQQQLFAAGGVAAHRTLIGHCCWSGDQAYHHRIANGGSYVGFDMIGFDQVWWNLIPPDDAHADNIAKLVRDGFRDQIILSQDRLATRPGRPNTPLTPQQVAKMEQLKERGIYNAWTYLFTDFIPMLKDRGVTDADIDSILKENPRRFFAGEVLPESPRAKA